MSDAQLRIDILAWLSDHARGHENAKPRKTTLLPWLCAQGHWPTPNDAADRALRKFKETMPEVGSCLRGYFLIITAEDRAVAEKTLHAPAMASLVRESEIRKSAPSGQRDLFGGEL